jgi:cytochrome c oxidase cbb3-type subunit 4
MNEFILNILRGAITIGLFGLFIALIAWAWSPRRREEFTDAANLVFDDTDDPRVNDKEMKSCSPTH